MQKVVPVQRLLLRAARLPLVAGGLALAILAGAILLTTLQVRRNIREQIARRDGEVLHAVTMMEYANDVDEGWEGPITDTGTQLGVVLKTSKLRGVLGVRLYDPKGQFVDAFPLNVRDAELNLRDLTALQALKPACRFHPALAVDGIFYSAARSGNTNGARTTPVLEVNVPLHTQADTRLAGIAQFLVEGSSIAAEYTRLDRHLATQAAVTFAAGGAILVVVLGWAFRRLRRAHALVAERTESLIKANQELALAAKTSALGAVAAHLIHGLSNPLAGLQNFVSAHGSSHTNGDGEADWQQAVASTCRMQSMIQRVISVLREDETGARYGVSLVELGEIIAQRVQPLARTRGVNFKMNVATDGELPNRVAHLVAFILENLAQNGIEATPPGKNVLLSATGEGEALQFELRDEGQGFPGGQTPFAPCRSAKDGGSGIGLALSKQLANHLGASLERKQNSDTGCVFALRIRADGSIVKAEKAREVVVD